MIIRIDLLRESEKRYQGIVSIRFAVRAGIITALCIASLVVYSMFNSFTSLRSKLNDAKTEWDKMSGQYTEATNMAAKVKELQVVLQEVQRWNDTRISWADALAILQDYVPTNIQFTRIEVNDKFKLPAVRTKESSFRKVDFFISGISHAKLQAEQTADIEKLKEIMKFHNNLTNVFEKVELEASNRSTEEDKDYLIFTIHGTGLERPIQ